MRRGIGPRGTQPLAPGELGAAGEGASAPRRPPGRSETPGEGGDPRPFWRDRATRASSRTPPRPRSSRPRSPTAGLEYRANLPRAQAGQRFISDGHEALPAPHQAHRHCRGFEHDTAVLGGRLELDSGLQSQSVADAFGKNDPTSPIHRYSHGIFLPSACHPVHEMSIRRTRLHRAVRAKVRADGTTDALFDRARAYRTSSVPVTPPPPAKHGARSSRSAIALPPTRRRRLLPDAGRLDAMALRHCSLPRECWASVRTRSRMPRCRAHPPARPAGKGTMALVPASASHQGER